MVSLDCLVNREVGSDSQQLVSGPQRLIFGPRSPVLFSLMSHGPSLESTAVRFFFSNVGWVWPPKAGLASSVPVLPR